MTQVSTWHQISRIAWLGGGVVAVNNPGPAVQVGAGLDGISLCTFTLGTYPSLIPTLQTRGFFVFGATFIESAEEAAGITPSQFLVLARNGKWRARDAQQMWRQITHSSAQQDQMLLSDLAARIASGLASSQTRMQHLCQAYGAQLRSRIRTLPVPAFARFKDTNSQAVYLAIHAMFWELAVLRDTLAEFAAAFACGFSGLTTMRGLVSKLRSAKASTPLAHELLAASDEGAGGWLSRFSTYRNLFTHSAPLQQVTGVSFAIQELQVLADGSSVPVIYFPLPADAATLVRRRSAGPLYKSFEELIDAARARPVDRLTAPDALDYLADCFDSLVDLAERLVASSPAPPQEITLTEADLIGEVTLRKE